MKKLSHIACIVCTAILALSCTKSLVPQICNEIEFKESHLYANMGEGISGFVTWTGESYFSSDFVLNVCFDDINGIETGQKATPVEVSFADPRVNGSAGFTSEYTGSIYLVKKSEKKADIIFGKVVMNIFNTDYKFDGCIHCTIE